jgi:hypothetical protein
MDLTQGTQLGTYNFQGPVGIAYIPVLSQFVVPDVVDNTKAAGQQTYGLREFKSDGTFLGAFSLTPPGGLAPDEIDGVAADLRGNPYIAYKNSRRFQLLELQGATVTLATSMPVNNLDFTGPAALGSNGQIIETAVINFDPKRRYDPVGMNDMTGGTLLYGSSDAEQTTQVIFSLPDPLLPTVHMAFGPQGTLYLVGPKPSASGFALMKVTPDQKVVTVPIPLTALPDGVWADPAGNVYLAQNSQNAPATLSRYLPDGTPSGSSALKLASGGYLTVVHGLSFDTQGHIDIAADGLDASNHGLRGIFVFKP